MNTHDKYELPPLPTIDVMGKTTPQVWFTAVEVDVLRRAAIEADRQERQSEAEEVCYEAYQVVGSLLSDLGIFETHHAEKILDNLSQAKMVHDDVLPWPSFDRNRRGEPVAAREAYDTIDSFLRNNLGDDGYALYSSALDEVYTAPHPAEPVNVSEARKYAKQELLSATDKAYRLITNSEAPQRFEGIFGRDDEPVKVPSDLRNAVCDLISTWREQQSEYPAEGKLAAAAVRLCANELEDLLARHGNQENSNG